jgi:hypothetical protein
MVTTNRAQLTILMKLPSTVRPTLKINPEPRPESMYCQ